MSLMGQKATSAGQFGMSAPPRLADMTSYTFRSGWCHLISIRLHSIIFLSRRLPCQIARQTKMRILCRSGRGETCSIR